MCHLKGQPATPVTEEEEEVYILSWCIIHTPATRVTGEEEEEEAYNIYAWARMHVWKRCIIYTARYTRYRPLALP